MIVLGQSSCIQSLLIKQPLQTKLLIINVLYKAVQGTRQCAFSKFSNVQMLDIFLSSFLIPLKHIR